MAEVLPLPSHFASSPRPDVSCDTNDGSGDLLSPSSGVEPGKEEEEEPSPGGRGAQERTKETRRRGDEGQEVEKQQRELSVLALLLAVLRKSLLGCKTERVANEDFVSMEIGWPTDVRHVVHVTFDRFHGFLGLPVEFEPEIHSRVPSASATVFGVSAEYMQCSYDSRGNSVPTILLLMQRRLYEQGGLQAEGIFRINAENSEEEYVRKQLNDGTVPEGIDVHCLAVLIKVLVSEANLASNLIRYTEAWFRELPSGLLDSLSSEQVMHCQTEEDCNRLARLLPPTEAALLDWAINLMADVVQEEHLNKMNARNVATVFAPNMAQMADPLTALMHAVQVMNFLRMLIEMTLKGRQEPTLVDPSASNADPDPSDENGHHCPRLHLESHSERAARQVNVQQSAMEILARVLEERPIQDEKAGSPQASNDAALPLTNRQFVHGSSSVQESGTAKGSSAALTNSLRKKMYRLNGLNRRKGRRGKFQSTTRLFLLTKKSKRTSRLSSIISKVERAEAEAI